MLLNKKKNEIKMSRGVNGVEKIPLNLEMKNLIIIDRCYLQ